MKIRPSYIFVPLLGALAYAIAMLFGAQAEADADMVLKGKYVIKAPDGSEYSTRGALNTAVEDAMNCSAQYGGQWCQLHQPYWDVSNDHGDGTECPPPVICPPPVECPDCPDPEICPEPEPCPDCPTCPDIPEPPEPAWADMGIEWEWPTARENGRALPIEELHGAVVEWRRVGDSRWIGQYAYAPDDTKIDLRLEPGDYEARVSAVDTSMRYAQSCMDANEDNYQDVCEVISEEPYVSEYATITWTVNEDGEVEEPCLPSALTNVNVVQAGTGYTVTLDKPACGEIQVTQCYDGGAANCWQNGVLMTVPATTGFSIIEFDRGNVGGGNTDCGFRFEHKVGSDLGYRVERWAGDLCDG